MVINLSGKSFEDSSLTKKIKRLISEYYVKPESIMFEVTETAAIGNLQKASKVLGKLQNLGCKTALDDFGIGYSFLNNMKNIQIDRIKIDRSFIENINKTPCNAAIVKTIIIF